MNYIIGQGGISAAVVAHSLHPSKQGKPLITLQLRYPRFIHSEFMTHRVFSRNASSSRAIPVAKMLDQVRQDTAQPIHWGKNQPGMQAHEETDAEVAIPAGDMLIRCTPEAAWIIAANAAADVAEAMSKAGYHKQVVNRLLEPFQFISVIVTATEWDNFFDLRDHPDAQPEIRALAVVMKKAISESKGRVLNYGDWHLPYIVDDERNGDYSMEQLRKMSAARCARVSYLTHDGQVPTPEKDFDLFDKLVGSVPLHASPIEHQATPDNNFGPVFANRDLWGNLQTWVQFRKLWEHKINNFKEQE